MISTTPSIEVILNFSEKLISPKLKNKLLFWPRQGTNGGIFKGLLFIVYKSITSKRATTFRLLNPITPQDVRLVYAKSSTAV